MEEKRDQNNNPNRPRTSQDIIDKTTDESGLHLQKPPKGAEQMNESFGKPDPDDLQQQADRLRTSNSKDNEENENRFWEDELAITKGYLRSNGIAVKWL